MAREQLRNAILEKMSIGHELLRERIIKESNYLSDTYLWVITENNSGLKNIYTAHMLCGEITINRVAIQQDMLEVLTN